MDERQPWERQKGEKNLWYDRFTRFRLMGSTRSLLALYKQEREEKGRKGKPRKAPTAWMKAAEKWQWRERAEAWDKSEREREQAEYEAERLEWRERRRHLLQGFFSKLAQALGQFDPTDASLGQLTPAVKAAVQELRAEFDDEPTARHDVTLGLDESTKQLLTQVGILAAHCITDSAMRDKFEHGLKGMMGEEEGA